MNIHQFVRHRNLEIMAMKNEGKHNIWIGVKFNLSASRIKAIVREMRNEYKAR